MPTRYKKRTWVTGHARKTGLCEKTHVRPHVREFDTKGQVQRKHARRPKSERGVDEAMRAEGTKPISNKRNLRKWQSKPGSTDVAGVDS